MKPSFRIQPEMVATYNWGRLCHAFKDQGNCQQCPVFREAAETGLTCATLALELPAQFLLTVDTWVDANPEPSYKDYFMARFPKAKVIKDRRNCRSYPDICIKKVFNDLPENFDGWHCGQLGGCGKHWDMPYNNDQSTEKGGVSQ